jgi:cytochrome c5
MIRRMLLACGFGVAVLVSVGGLRAAEAPAPAQRLPVPDHLSQQTRSEIKSRMTRHGETMSNLVRSVVLLDRRTIRVLAGRIADEEVIARTDAAGEKKRPLLPSAFFAAQDELSAGARQLAIAAKDGADDKLVAERFAAVARTCVTCHSAYLHGRPEPGPAGPPASDGSKGK